MKLPNDLRFPTAEMIASSSRAKKFLAAESSCDLRTVERWLRGDRIKPVSAERLTDAARALGMQLPVLPGWVK